jgi:hypothetical protein
MKAVDVADRVLRVLLGRGERSFEQLFLDLPDLNWLQLSMALEKLTRNGEIGIWRSESGEYRVVAKEPQVVH